MSVLLETEDGWIISHLNYLRETYSGFHCSAYEKLFNINSQYLRDNQFPKSDNGVLRSEDNNRGRKRKKRRENSSPGACVELVKRKFEEILTDSIRHQFFSNSRIVDNNAEARSMSEEFFKRTFDNFRQFYGHNRSQEATINAIENIHYLFPKNSEFYSYDIRDISEKLKVNEQFDFLLMDPPWWNKFVRRKLEKNEEAGYKMMYNDELMKIPVEKLLNERGIVAVWCTNAASHNSDVIGKIFPTWGIKPVATWYWIKVTKSGHPICHFNPGILKQPYESLIFGVRITNEELKIPENKIIISVPSAVHSHKPPIARLVEQYLPEGAKCIELFARYLLPNWTSYGCEVLKFQHLWLFTSEESESS